MREEALRERDGRRNDTGVAETGGETEGEGGDSPTIGEGSPVTCVRHKGKTSRADEGDDDEDGALVMARDQEANDKAACTHAELFCALHGAIDLGCGGPDGLSECGCIGREHGFDL